MKKVFVTGCAGFIGQRTAEMLLERGVEVVGLDNLNDYYDVRLKEYRLAQLQKRAGFEFVKGDIEDKAGLQKIFSSHQFDVVFNLAARAGVRYSMENPDIYLSTNTEGTLNLLNQMKEHGVPKFVLASTSSLYAGQPTPFSEEMAVNTPISPYAASKKGAEMFAYAYHHLYGIDVSVLRYFTVYGPAGRPDMSIFRFIKWIDEGTPIQLFGDGTQNRDFTYVDDIAEGTILAAKKVGYEVFNLGGGGQPISLNEIIELIEKELGKNATVNYQSFHTADMFSTQATIEKAKEVFGWRPATSTAEGIKHCIRWYLDNKEWLRGIAV